MSPSEDSNIRAKVWPASSKRANAYLARMTEGQTMQAILRFARGDSGATVVACPFASTQKAGPSCRRRRSSTSDCRTGTPSPLNIEQYNVVVELRQQHLVRRRIDLVSKRPIAVSTPCPLLNRRLIRR